MQDCSSRWGSCYTELEIPEDVEGGIMAMDDARASFQELSFREPGQASAKLTNSLEEERGYTVLLHSFN